MWGGQSSIVWAYGKVNAVALRDVSDLRCGEVHYLICEAISALISGHMTSSIY